ncbi:MAG TPA: aspartyl protease family protein [Povalibacter sp.]
MTGRKWICMCWLSAAVALTATAATGRDSDPAETLVPASAVTRFPVPSATPAVTQPEHLFASPTRADRIGRVMAPVMINGRGPFRMIVDTGANQSVLTYSAAAMLGLTPAADAGVKLTGVTGSQMVPTITVDTFETGSVSQRNLRVAVMHSVSGGAEGILGMQGFAGKRITVDFVNDRIRIADSRGQRAARNFAAIPVTIRFGRLLLAEGRVGGVRVHAVIDTGAERTLGNRALRDALVRLKRLPAPPTSAGVIGLTEVEQRGEAIWTRRISLGDVDITDVDVIYGDIHVFKVWDLETEPALLVGMDILGMLHTIIVDYRIKEVQIRPR